MNTIEMAERLREPLAREVERFMHDDSTDADAAWICGRYADRGERCPWCLDATLMSQIGRALAPSIADINESVAEYVKSVSGE